MAPFTRQARDTMICKAIHAIEANVTVKSREYSGLREFDRDLQEFIEKHIQLPGILELATSGFSLFLSLRDTLDHHFREYQEKLAAFKAASSAATAIPLAEEILRIAIVRNFKIRWVILRLNVAVTDILDPTICCTRKECPPFVDPPTQRSRLITAIRVAQEQLKAVVMRQEHQTKPFEEVLQLASQKRTLNSQLFLDWLEYRIHMNDIEAILAREI